MADTVNLTATYDDPQASDKDMVRFTVGDIDMSRPLLYDEEIEAALQLEHNRMYALLYRTMGNRLALISKRDLGPQSEDFSKAIEYYNNLARQYEAASVGMAAPSINLQARRSRGIFRTGLHDNV